MNKERVKSVQKNLGSSKRQAESIVTAQERIQQNMDSAEYNREKAEAKTEEKKAEIKEKEEENYDSQAWLEHRTPDADRALVAAIQEGKVNAIELFSKILGRLKEQSEQIIRYELSNEAEERIAQRSAEIQREFDTERSRGAGSSEDSLPTKPSLLL